MDNTFLFFDIECANCFNGIGKMCSLGYVIINENFEILDEDDVVMNPETEFDWYLSSQKTTALSPTQKIISECSTILKAITQK